MNELEQIVNTGTKLNIRYFLDQFLEEELQEEIYAYFKQLEELDLNLAVDHFDGEFSHEELQLMHIQFMSDMGI